METIYVIIIIVLCHLGLVYLNYRVDKWSYKKGTGINIVPLFWVIPIINILSLIVVCFSTIQTDNNILSHNYWENKWKDIDNQ